ncbi:hypothetical protein [Mycolicibacter terrae]|nr:hypothetical protein [Mycolicibacter terrae]
MARPCAVAARDVAAIATTDSADVQWIDGEGVATGHQELDRQGH